MPLAPIPISNRRIRFALVGCGRIAAKHIEALEKHGDRAELVAVCDTDPEALKAAVAADRAPGFASLERAARRLERRRHRAGDAERAPCASRPSRPPKPGGT